MASRTFIGLMLIVGAIVQMGGWTSLIAIDNERSS